ncbi:MAG: universal stress protein [Dehalococcoidales bacterium]|nr:universal stress protein [Dehalococcoidales bacterium]
MLVPLDGSMLAESVIPFVNEIILGAKESRKIEITLLQVIPSKTDYVPEAISDIYGGIVHVPYTEAELEQIKKSAIAYLNKIAATFKKDPHVTIKTLTKVGDDPADEILKASDEQKIDLIAISTHGRSGITRWAFGSVADRILRGGTTPVFMIRAPNQPK